MSWSVRTRLLVVLGVALVLAVVATVYIRGAAARTPSVAAAGPAVVTLDAAPVLLTVTDRHLATMSTMDPGGPRAVSSVEPRLLVPGAESPAALGVAAGPNG